MEYTGNTYTVKSNLLIQQMTQEFCNKTELYISIFRQLWNQQSPSAIFIIKKSSVYNRALQEELYYNRPSMRYLRGYIYKIGYKISQ